MFRCVLRHFKSQVFFFFCFFLRKKDGDECGSSTASAAPLSGGYLKKEKIPVPIQDCPKAFGQRAADG